jgi:hypothetical protein
MGTVKEAERKDILSFNSVLDECQLPLFLRTEHLLPRFGIGIGTLNNHVLAACELSIIMPGGRLRESVHRSC